MSIECADVNGNYVWRDPANTWRWYDAVGPDVRKWELSPAQVATTTTAYGSTVTATNGTLVAVDSVSGGAVLVTLGGTDNDKLEAQGVSETFYFAARWPAYYGVKFGQMVDADQTDVNAGFIIRDTDIAGGVTDGIYFRTVDESAVLALVLEKDSGETATTLFTAAESTDYLLELYYDGTNVYAYVNGTLAATVAATNANFCNDEHLAATFAVQAGENSANNVRLYWAKAIQVQSAS